MLELVLKPSRRRRQARSTEGVEGERDGLVDRQRPALLPRLCQGTFVELGADRAERLLVSGGGPCGEGAAELLSQRLRAGKEPGGRFRSSLGSEGVSKTEEVPRDLHAIAEVAVDPQALFQHREGVIDLALVDGDRRQSTQRSRLDALVACRTYPAEVLLVERAAAFAVAEHGAHPGEVVSREQRVVLVAELAEASDALVEDLLRPFEIAFVGGGDAEQEDGVGDAPLIPEFAMERERFL